VGRINKRAQRKREIAQAALELFANQGYEGATLELLAQSLGQTRQVIYHYFESKEDLVFYIIEESLNRTEAILKTLSESCRKSSEKLGILIDFFFEDYESGQGYFSIHSQIPGFMEKLPGQPRGRELTTTMGALTKNLIALVKEGVENGEFIALDPEVLGGMIFSWLTGILGNLHHPALQRVSKESLKTETRNFILRGIQK